MVVTQIQTRSAQIPVHRFDEGSLITGWLVGNLVIYPARKAECLHPVQLFQGRTEARLLEESRGLFAGYVSGGPAGQCIPESVGERCIVARNTSGHIAFFIHYERTRACAVLLVRIAGGEDFIPVRDTIAVGIAILGFHTEERLGGGGILTDNTCRFIGVHVGEGKREPLPSG